MKKILKPLCAVLIVALLCSLPLSFAGADATGVCFTATNDNLQDLSLRASYVGGAYYVPYTLFTVFGVSANYFPADNVAMLNVGSNQILFYLNDGTCKDGNGNELPLSASFVNGMIYVPAHTGHVFGLLATTITGNGYGDVVRITNGGQVYTNAQFLEGAASMMKSRYEQYFGVASPPPAPTPEPSESPEIKGGKVYLSFIGLPSAKLLDTLKNYGVSATFFLTAEDAVEDPDLVRRLIGDGNTVGVYCDTDPEDCFEDAAGAIRETAFYSPTLMTSFHPKSEGHSDFAAVNGCAFYSPGRIIEAGTSDASIVNLSLPKNQAISDYCLYTGEDTEYMLPYILQYMSANKYTALPVLETSF